MTTLPYPLSLYDTLHVTPRCIYGENKPLVADDVVVVMVVIVEPFGRPLPIWKCAMTSILYNVYTVSFFFLLLSKGERERN